MKIYIAGPMTGVENFNYPEFHAAATRFRDKGWDVANPAENFAGRTDLPYGECIRADLIELAQCDAIALLPGWGKSRGARLEVRIAKMIGLSLFDAISCEPIRSNIKRSRFAP